MALKKVINSDNAARFKFVSPGDSIEGYLLQSKPKLINGDEVTEHLFQTPAGLVSCLGNFKLNEALASVPAGSYTRATFTGVMKLKRGTMKLFDVEYDDEDAVQVGVISGGATKNPAPVAAAAPEEETYETEEVVEDFAEETLAPPSKVNKAPAAVTNAKADEVRRMLAARRSKA